MKIYRIKEAVESGLLPISLTTLRKLHKEGRINLVNLGTEGRPTWGIAQSEIDRYHKTIMKESEHLNIKTT